MMVAAAQQQWKRQQSCWRPLTHSNKQTNIQAGFIPEPKNLMLSLVLFTLFPSLEQRQQHWRHGAQAEVAANMKIMMKLMNPESNKQTAIWYIIAVFKPGPKNLMLSLVLFTLFPSLERRQWWWRRQWKQQRSCWRPLKPTNKQADVKSNLNLKTLCFPLCFSHSSHFWNDVNDGGGGGTATMKTTNPRSNIQT